MKDWFRNIVVCSSLVAAIPASASTLNGDSLSITFQPGNNVLGANVTVGPGVDLTLGGFTFDLNAGADGDEFIFMDGGGFFSGSTSLVLSDLDFSDGSSLVNFSLLSTSLTSLSFVVGPDSLTFTYDNPGFGPNNGPAISGRFLTSAAVPEPTTPLLILLGGLATAMTWRRRTVK